MRPHLFARGRLEHLGIGEPKQFIHPMLNLVRADVQMCTPKARKQLMTCISVLHLKDFPKTDCTEQHIGNLTTSRGLIIPDKELAQNKIWKFKIRHG